MRVLSLFDGMACGMLAMQKAGIEVEQYVAFEIDKYAVQTATHNFPMIEQRGDVFQADFAEYSDFDFLIGGSPCTYWSIAQKNNRETEASGMGWELFSQYVRALHEAKPKFFVYENNKSMAKAIRESIDEAFGFEAICINSALVSAQNRQRLYWVGKRNEDGSYSKVNVEQPEDRGIVLRDILESGQCWMDKSYTVDSNYHKTLGQQGFDHQSGRKKMAAEPVAVDLQVVGRKRNDDGEWERSWEAHTDGKASALTSVESRRCVAEPVAVTPDGKAFCLTANYPGAHIPHSWEKSVRSMVAEPVGTTKDGKAYCLTSYYSTGQNAPHTLTKALGSMAAEPVCVAERGRYAEDGSIEQHFEAREDGKLYRRFETHNEEKANALTTVQTDSMVGIPGDVYAVHCEWDENGKPTKAISTADGKIYPVYEVKDGKITIKGKQFPIKLADGYYIIRKLTVRECMRLQTVPEWYEFPVSDSQAYKMLGNGWTVDVIAHLLKGCMAAGEPVQYEKKPQKVIVRRANRG